MEVLKIFGGVAAITVVFTGLCLWGGSYLSRAMCEQVADTMNREHQWMMLGGCFIRTRNGEWWPLNQYRKFGAD